MTSFTFSCQILFKSMSLFLYIYFSCILRLTIGRPRFIITICFIRQYTRFITSVKLNLFLKIADLIPLFGLLLDYHFRIYHLHHIIILLIAMNNLIKFKTEFDVHARSSPSMQGSTKRACTRLRKQFTSRR